MFYLFNGQLKEENDKVSITPIGEGYRYGFGLFETMLVSEGELEFYNEHMDRLKASCEALDITFRIHRDEIKSAILDLVRLNHIEEGSVRLQVSKTKMGSDYWIMTDHLKKRPDTFKLKVSDWIKGSKNPIVSHKSTQYGGNLMELTSAKEKGFDEVLFFNEMGFLTEGAYTNVFFIKNSKLYTPRLENGLLAGIMRAKIIEAARALNIECFEVDLTMEDIKDKTAAFVTNSLIGVKSISSINDIDFEIQDLQTWLIHRVKG